MKKNFLMVAGLLAICLSAFSIDVPKAVTEALAKKFPGATEVKWAKENSKEYEAEFKLNGKSASANFLTDGTWVETEMEISIAEVPAVVTSSVQKKYPGAVISRVYKIENAKGEVTFEAEIKTGNKKKELLVHPDGTIIK